MQQKLILNTSLLLLGLFLLATRSVHADILPLNQPLAVTRSVTQQTIVKPDAPHLNAPSYILIDAYSGKVLAEKAPDERRAPASLTKIMTMYVVANALKEGRIKLDDLVLISKKAWKTPGSKMFINVDQRVPVKDLILGVVVHSGNDACVALAEHVAGSENAFASLMNQHAKALGMNGTHFVNSDGLPSSDQYTTATDMAILARAFVHHFPEYYPWFREKTFTFNGIEQDNRNRLLWNYKYADGIKTGHTEEAGYCLVASALKDQMRLVSVVMGSSSASKRVADSKRLLTYGFRFFSTHKLYSGSQPLREVRTWFGDYRTIPAGIQNPLYITVLNGQYKDVRSHIEVEKNLRAPIEKGQAIGKVVVTLKEEPLYEEPLLALEANPKGGIFDRMIDTFMMRIHSWFHLSES